MEGSMADTAMFGFTAREVTFMRSLKGYELEGFLATLRAIRALPEWP
jgi:hypothetical protein